MLQFHEITLSDKPAVDRCAALANDRFCEHCFADIFIWQGNYNTDIAFWEDFCFLRMLRAEGPAVYLAPFGGGDYLAALALVEEDAAQNGVTDEALLKEAEQAIRVGERIPKKRKLYFYGAFWAALGAAVMGLIWIGSILIL